MRGQKLAMRAKGGPYISLSYSTDERPQRHKVPAYFVGRAGRGDGDDGPLTPLETHAS